MSSGSTHARCGLPTSTASPANGRPPTIASPVPSWLVLPISTVTSAVVSSPLVQHHRARPGQRADHEFVAALQPHAPQVMREYPDPVAAHLRRSSRRRCGSPCTSRRRPHHRAAGRTRRRPTPPRRSSPAAPRRRPDPRRRSHSAATAAGVSDSRPSGSGNNTKSFCVPWPLANITCSGYVAPHPQRVARRCRGRRRRAR